MYAVDGGGWRRWGGNKIGAYLTLIRNRACSVSTDVTAHGKPCGPWPKGSLTLDTHSWLTQGWSEPCCTPYIAEGVSELYLEAFTQERPGLCLADRKTDRPLSKLEGMGIQYGPFRKWNKLGHVLCRHSFQRETKWTLSHHVAFRWRELSLDCIFPWILQRLGNMYMRLILVPRNLASVRKISERTHRWWERGLLESPN